MGFAYAGEEGQRPCNAPKDARHIGALLLRRRQRAVGCRGDACPANVLRGRVPPEPHNPAPSDNVLRRPRDHARTPAAGPCGVRRPFEPHVMPLVPTYQRSTARSGSGRNAVRGSTGRPASFGSTAGAGGAGDVGRGAPAAPACEALPAPAAARRRLCKTWRTAWAYATSSGK